MKKYLLILFILILPSFSVLLRPGFFPMQDNMQAFRIYQMMRCFDSLQLPCRWVPDMGFGYGYPLYIFYAPGPYYVGALISLATYFHDAVKILFIFGFVASGVSMYLLSHDVFKNRLGALASAVLYVYLPVRAVQVYVRGSLGENLALIFFPLIFLFYYRLVHKYSKTDFILSVLSLSALILTHNLMSYVFFPLFLAWTVIHTIVQKQPHKIIPVFISLLFSLGLTAFFVIPLITERQYVHLNTLIGGYFGYQQHFVNWYRLFVSHAWGYGSSAVDLPSELSLSVGQVHWMLALAALVLSLLNIKKSPRLAIPVILLSVIEVGVLFMMHAKSTFIWQAIPQLAFLQFPWRLLTISGFVTAFIAGTIVHRKIMLIGIIVITIFIYGPFFQPKSWDPKHSDANLFTQDEFLRQQTTSLYDYLPISAATAPPTASTAKPVFLAGSGSSDYYTVESNYQSGNIQVTSASALVQLPMYDFPGMKVQLNGQPVSHSFGPNGLIEVEVPSGQHHLKTYLSSTSDRRAGDIVSVLSLLALSLLVLI